MIREAKDTNIGTSLAVFKPAKIIDFTYREINREWDKEKLEYIKINAMQQDLFRSTKNIVEVVKKLPYKFSYTFEDEDGRRSKMMIEDWETGQLYWNCLKRRGDEKKACELVREKYIDDFAKTKDLYLFLGTKKKFHNMAPNPFVIIGTFHPKFIIQPYLDF